MREGLLPMPAVLLQPARPRADRSHRMPKSRVALLLRMACSTVDAGYAASRRPTSEWTESAFERWGFPPADPEPLVVGEMKLPLVWRAFLVVARHSPLDDARYGERSPPMGYSIADLPTEPGETAPAGLVALVWGITRMESFAPGDLVHARGREWIALPSPEPDWLCLRPLSGAEV